MRRNGLLGVTMLALLASLSLAAPCLAQQQPPAAQQPPSASTPIKAQTRLITLDVVVTDSKGNTVRGLKQEDFQISEGHGEQQKIAHFEFVDLPANAAAAAQPAGSGPGVFSNIQPARFRTPPTAILMDALNTTTDRQLQVRRDMLLLLKKLPTDTPVAVFLLGHTVRLVQNFTSDPALLRAAIDKLNGPTMRERNPQDDPDSVSNRERDMPAQAQMPENLIEELENFEKEEFAEQTKQRAQETADAMKSIAKYLGGYSGRKNLIWFSEAFPLWIAPNSDFGSDPFAGAESYDENVRVAAAVLTDAQVSVYPVDARDLDPEEVYSAAQNPNINRRNPGAGFGTALRNEDEERIESQVSMEEVAEDTGGQLCKGTNDPAGCVQHDLNESSAYYVLSYYPENVKWDGQFHRIMVKTPQHGLKLAYRRGYFATNLSPMARHEGPDKLLQQACRDPLPSTAIPLTVAAVPPQQEAGKAPDSRFLVTIPTSALIFQPDGAARSLNVQMAICEFDPKGSAFQFFSRDLSRPVPDDVYKAWQAQGVRNIFDYDAKPEDQRLRFAVLDMSSGLTGSIDVPAHPKEFASLPGLAAPPSAPGPASAQAANAAPPKPAQVLTKVNFRAGAASSALDWSGDAVSYHGELSVAQGAPAFFKSLYGAKFHCDGGSLVANDANSSDKPSFLLTLHNATGAGALVELGGDAPAYSGNLPVDASARAFFDYLWKLCHCQQP